MTDEMLTRLQDIPPELPKGIARLAWGGGVVMTLLPPLIFLAVGYQSEVSRIDSGLLVGVQSIAKQSRMLSGKVRGEFLSLQEVMASLDWLKGDTGIRITGADKQLLVEKRADLSYPLLTRTVPVILGDGLTGQLEMSRSLRSLFQYALLMFVPGLLLGFVAYLTLRGVPMHALQLALQELTIRKRTEEQLAKALSIFSATLDSTADGIFVTDTLGRQVVSNQRFLDLWNLHKSASSSDSNNEILAAIASQLRDPTAFFATHKDLTRDIDVNHGAILELRDGRRIEWNSRPQFLNGKVIGRVSSFRDISEKRRAEALLAAEKEVLEMVVCGSSLKTALDVLACHVEVLSGEMFCAILFRENNENSNPVFATGRGLPHSVVDGFAEQGQVALNEVFVDITNRGETQEHGLSDEFSGVIEDIDTNPAWAGYCDLVSQQGIQASFAVAIRSSVGHLLGLVVAHYRNPSEQPLHDREIIWVAAHLSSIAIERRQAENRLQVMAHYDALTLLPNRVLFRDRLNQALVHAERNNGVVALLFLDLDRFKTINDTLGHDSGDLLLCEISTRLRSCVRETDTVARLGGDEFTIILEHIAKPGDAANVAGKIIESLALPILLRGQEAFVAPSIGLTIYPSDSDNADQLIKNADAAMYRAKEEGGNGYRFFTTEMDIQATGRLEMESSLRHALERDEFIVYYQPKLDLSDNKIIGAEALLRWKHPGRGLVSPAEFIPILEETGLIVQVGAWVLKNVCAQIRTWQDNAALPPLIVAVNLSGRQLQRNNLSTTIAEILEETGLDPKFLELEVTESMLMHDPKWAIDSLMQIRARGILHIDVDDFGTGYSSLSYLKQFPIDCLKLDKSFVDGLPDDENDVAISLAVIALAHSLKLIVVAEGVENDAQLAFLKENGCNVIQGYIVSTPLPADDFVELVKKRRFLNAPMHCAVDSQENESNTLCSELPCSSYRQ